MNPTTPTLDQRQRGSAMLVVCTILVALLAGGGTALYLQLQSTRSVGLTKAATSTLYCAEAGLAAARPTIALNYTAWAALLDADTTNDPPWYPLTGDLDGDGVDDYSVTVEDNDDEVVNNKNVDSDLRIFMISTCIANPEVPRTVRELVEFGGGGHIYRSQSGGGAGNNGNANQ